MPPAVQEMRFMNGLTNYVEFFKDSGHSLSRTCHPPLFVFCVLTHFEARGRCCCVLLVVLAVLSMNVPEFVVQSMDDSRLLRRVRRVLEVLVFLY